MRKLCLLTAVIAMTVSSLFAQEIKRCNTTEYMQQMFLENPGYKEQLEKIDAFTTEYIKNNPSGTRTVVTIPVVVHVVYNTTAENISDALVNSQITVLNEDYRRLNADANETPAAWLGVAADCEINFCLAARDPSGNATNGITRTSTTKTSFSDGGNPVKFTSMGGHDAWDRNKYLNLWVCDLAGGLLGYAQFPGGPANTDGVVCDYKYTGLCSNCAPYQYGRSATHEVGHWLNLRHIWGDDGTGCNGSDLVADTPNQADETYQCPLPTIRISCTNGPDGDMYSNYMDYTDDGCMNIFTAGQKSRMQAVLAPGGARVSLLTSDGCVPPGGGSCNVPAGLNVTAITTNSATLNWGAATGAITYNIQYKAVSSGTWIPTTSSTTSKAISGLTASTQYEFQVESACSGGTSGYSASTNFTTSAPACTDAYEPNNTKNTAKPITVGVGINALLGVSGDIDWFSFANSVSEPNIQATLSALPANYNLDLYEPGGAKIVASKSGGLNDEVIKWNTSVVGTYKLRVYGASNAFNATVCYSLLAQIGSSPFRSIEITETPIVGGEMTNLYPNPSNGNMVVEYNSISNSSVQLIAYDMMGKVIFSEQTYANEGSNSYSVNINNLANGIYMFEIRNGNEISRMKFSIDK